MDVFQAIRTRRSIRKYRQEPIIDEKLDMILEAACLAPSAGNRQQWRFIVVQNAHRKKQVVQIANNQAFLKDASAIVVGGGDPDASTNWHEKDHDSPRRHRFGGDSPGLRSIEAQFLHR